MRRSLLILLFATTHGACTDPHDAGDATGAGDVATAPTNDDAVGDEGSDDVSGATTADDDADLIFLREEEKLARDVYDLLDETWGTPQVFANIRQSEQSHMDALGVALDQRGLTDPIVDDTRGVFQDPRLSDLYVDLTTQGSDSVVAALTVGATIEDLDIVDLRVAIDTTNDADLADTYARLMCGSYNHLRAFVGQLDREGVAYAPQYLTPAEMSAILDGPRERCD